MHDLFEYLNSVLKEYSALLFKTVELYMINFVQYFSTHREEAAHARYPFSFIIIWRKYVKY